jgi:hypothetical protein
MKLELSQLQNTTFLLGKTAESWHINGSMFECFYLLNQSMQ